jgi:non-specific protein-tyrosine kinase
MNVNSRTKQPVDRQTLDGRGAINRTSGPDLVTLTHPRSGMAEAYRTLRTNLYFSSPDHPLRSLVVTSPAPDEQKAIVLANLAVTFAQGGRRTILVDADLRRPAQHTLFGLSNDTGLTTTILKETSQVGSEGLEPLLETVGVDNLWLLPSGPLPPNPAELLGSRRMDEIVASLARSADIVLFDAPPVIAVSDAAILAAKLDGLLLVINAGHTRREHAQRAKQVLEKLNIRIVGTILANAPVDATVTGY